MARTGKLGPGAALIGLLRSQKGYERKLALFTVVAAPGVCAPSLAGGGRWEEMMSRRAVRLPYLPRANTKLLSAALECFRLNLSA